VTARVALLRGVNVGGKNRLSMQELRAALAAAGFGHVSTVLQSGNVVFDHAGSEDDAVEIVRTTIADAFALDVGVVVRSGAELAAVVAASPFLVGTERRDPTTLHVAFLASAPAGAAVAALDPDRSPPDAFAVRGRDVYLSYPGGSGRSSLTLDYLERTLGVHGTARNWHTVQRLAEILPEG
jgi:uncharacterized protein (DUF1697 family)